MGDPTARPVWKGRCFPWSLHLRTHSFWGLQQAPKPLALMTEIEDVSCHVHIQCLPRAQAGAEQLPLPQLVSCPVRKEPWLCNPCSAPHLPNRVNKQTVMQVLSGGPCPVPRRSRKCPNFQRTGKLVQCTNGPPPWEGVFNAPAPWFSASPTWGLWGMW